MTLQLDEMYFVVKKVFLHNTRIDSCEGINVLFKLDLFDLCFYSTMATNLYDNVVGGKRLVLGSPQEHPQVAGRPSLCSK